MTAGQTTKSAVWVFSGHGAQFPSGVFYEISTAEAWIAKHRLSGTLTEYPLDYGAYDWAIEHALFTPTKPHQFEPEFIGRFSGGYRHHHYEQGKRET